MFTISGRDPGGVLDWAKANKAQPRSKTRPRDRGLGDRDVSYLAEVRAREANARIEPQDS